MLMDKKVVKSKKKINLKQASWLVLVAGLAAGIALVTVGIVKLCGYNAEMGNDTVDQLDEKLIPLTEEYQKVQQETLAELSENGASDKYIELSQKSNDLNKQITNLTKQRTMKTDGYHNPRNVKEAIELAPTILIGAVVLCAGIVAFVVLRQLA